MISKSILILTLITFTVHIKAKSFYSNSNWSDEESTANDWDGANNWEISNTLAKPDLLDFDSRTSAVKPRQVRWDWLTDMYRKLYVYLPKIPIRGPGIMGQEYARDEYNQTTRPWTARVPIEYLGQWPYDFL